MTPLRILQLSTFDVAGGAEQVAMNLHRGFRARGHDATLAVGGRRSDEPGVVLLDNLARRGAWGAVERAALEVARHLPDRAALLVRAAALVSQPARRAALLRGLEDFEMPASREALEASPPPDVLHCHNLHGDYFDLRTLPGVSARVPTFLTLHDMWTFTGHCAYSLGCARWRGGCGECPDLKLHPAVFRDGTRENLLRKRDLYRRSRLHVAAPSRWLLEQAKASVLAEGTVAWRVIPYGVDLQVFRSGDRAGARERLGIPPDARVLLYVANEGKANPFKDYRTVAEAVKEIATRTSDARVLFLVLGGSGAARREGRTHHVPFVKDRAVLAAYYQAADLFLHAAREDNFPNTILESLACGTPVVATAVGGIPEQIEDGVTGVLVPPGGAREMADSATTLLEDAQRLSRMRTSAAERARKRHDLSRHVADYCDWFDEVRATFGAQLQRPSP